MSPVPKPAFPARLTSSYSPRLPAPRPRARRLDSPRPPPVATLTVRIAYLTRHLVAHHKDKASKRSMALLIGQRNRMLKYLLSDNREMYRRVCIELKVGPWKQLQRTVEQAAAEGQ